MLIPNKHNGYSADGRRLYPIDFGGGGQQQTSGGTAVQELPEWARPYAKGTLEKGAALTERPYQAYGSVNPATGQFEAAPRIAGFSQMQLDAQKAAAGMAPSAATGAGIDVAAEAAKRGLGAQYQAGQFQNQFQAPGEYQPGQFNARQVSAPGLQQYQMGPFERVSGQNLMSPEMQAAQSGYQPNLQQYQMGPAERVRTQSFTRPGAAESYMSPYMQNVVDIQKREAQRSSDIAGQAEQAQAVGRGAFGGSRDALMRAERARNLATQMGDIQATGQQAAFQNAQQQFNQEQQARLAAQQANQQAGLTVGGQNLSALLGVQGLGAQYGTQMALANLSNQQQAAVQNQAAQLQTQGLSAQQAMQAALANQQAGLTTGQQNLAAQLGVQQLGANQDLQAQLANQQYGMQAQQLGEQSRQFGAGQGLQAASLGAQYGQAAQQLGEQSRQYGAGYGLQGLQAALQGAGQLGSLGGQQFQQGMDINKLQSAYGGQQQALRQQGLTQAYEDFQNEQNYPYKQLGFMSDLIRGLPLGQMTTRSMYEPGPNAAQQLGATGMGLYGLSKFMAEGGMAYADGGEVEGYKLGGGVDSRDNVEDIVSNLRTDQDLQKALMAARARGDTDQAEAVEAEMALRASLRRGIAGGITNQMADRMAGGGVVAFAGDEEENGPAGQLVVSPGNPDLYRRAGQEGFKTFEELGALKGYKPLTAEDRRALTKENYEELQQFAGVDPYAPMAKRIAQMDADRLVNLEKEKGAAAFEAIPAILEGRGIRGIGKGLGKLGSGLAAAAKADAVEKRALANQDFLIQDAQRKERMGLTRDAMSMTDKIEAAGVAAAKAKKDALVAKGNLAANLAKAYRPVGTGGAGGAGKAPKLPERLYNDNVANMLATEKPKEGESDAAFKARINAAAGELTARQVKDMGPEKAAAAAATTAVTTTRDAEKAWDNMSRKEKRQFAKDNGVDVYDAKQKYLDNYATRAQPSKPGNTNPAPGGRLMFDAQGNQIK